MIVVTSMFDQSKAYVLGDLLCSFAALEAPEGEALRFLLVVAGALEAEDEALLAEFSRRGDVTLSRGPEVDVDPELRGWRYQVAGTLRERVRAEIRDGDGWVFWVDSDTLHFPEDLRWLHSHGRAMASGWALQRTAGFVMAEGLPDTYGVREVSWTGMGSFLCRAELVRAISWAPFLAACAAGECPKEPWGETGEDHYFCHVATQRAGEKVLLDPDVCPWHVDATGLAIRAKWREDGTMARDRQVRGEGAVTRPALVPLHSGTSPRFGEMVEGKPFWTFADGSEIPVEQMREWGEESQLLDFVEGAEVPAEAAGETPAG